MAKASPAQVSFNAGELSPRIEGRIDLDKYRDGCRTMENLIPLIQGGAMKRSGTRFVHEVKDSADSTRLISFEFGTTQAYVLEFSDQVMRIYKDSALVLETNVAITSTTNATPVVVTTTAAHRYVDGDEVYITGLVGAPAAAILNNRFYIINQLSATTFELNGTTAPGSTTTGGNSGRVAELYKKEPEKVITDITRANPGVVSSTAHGYTTGERVFIRGALGMVEVNDLYFYVGTTTANTFQLDGVDTTAYGAYDTATDAGRVSRLVRGSPYTSAQVEAIATAQSADVLYCAHPDVAPQKIERRDHHEWTASEIAFAWPAFRPENTDEAIKLAVSDNTIGTGRTLRANANVFKSTDVGRYFKLRQPVEQSGHRTWISFGATADYDGTALVDGDLVSNEGNMYEINVIGLNNRYGTTAPLHREGTVTDGHHDYLFVHSGAGYVKVTAFTAPDQVTVQVIKTCPELYDYVLFSPGDGHWMWSESAWGGGNGFPRSVTFFEDRLWWGGAAADPQTFWASRTQRYEDHETFDEDDSALVFTLNTDDVNLIEWMRAQKVLQLGTAGGEFIVSGGEGGITPGNITAVRHSSYGSKEFVPPESVEQVTLFAQRAGRKVRELVFDFETESYLGLDLTILSDHVTITRIRKMAFAQEPNRILWCVLEDGQLVAMTYERGQEVVAWHRHPIGGTAVDVESVAVIPHPDGDRDQVWLVVKRTINGGTKRYVEYFEQDWLRTQAIEDGLFVDSGLTYDGVSTTSITGLGHLALEIVAVLSDGIYAGTFTVSAGGVLTLTTAASVVQVGLAYSAILETMRLEAGGADGVAQGKTMRVTNAVVRLDQTGEGLAYGPDATHLDEYKITAGTLVDGDTDLLSWPGGYERAGRLYLRHNRPTPFTTTGIFPQLVTQDR